MYCYLKELDINLITCLDIVLEIQDIKPRDDCKRPRTEITTDLIDNNGLLSSVDCNIDLDVPLPPQPLTGKHCRNTVNIMRNIFACMYVQSFLTDCK